MKLFLVVVLLLFCGMAFSKSGNGCSNSGGHGHSGNCGHGGHSGHGHSHGRNNCHPAPKPCPKPDPKPIPNPPKPIPVPVPQPIPNPVVVNTITHIQYSNYGFSVPNDIELTNKDIDDEMVVYDIQFDFDKYLLKKDTTKSLDFIVDELKRFPRIKINIIGNTDNIGTEEYNIRLSEERARAVKNYLITNGISEDRITYEGVGYSNPVTSNDTALGRYLNRRTEFVITAK